MSNYKENTVNIPSVHFDQTQDAVYTQFNDQRLKPSPWPVQRTNFDRFMDAVHITWLKPQAPVRGYPTSGMKEMDAGRIF
jgi:hypothetical protein